MTPVGSGDPLADHLLAGLASQLRTPFLESDAINERVEAYVHDVNRLTGAAEEATGFLNRVIDHYLSGTTDPALREKRAAELRRALPPIPQPRSQLSAEFLARPAADVVHDLTRSVAQAGGRLVAALSNSFRSLTRLCVSGLIDRPAPDVCRFTFFDEVLTQRVTKSQKRKRKKAAVAQTPVAGRTVIGHDTVTESETTTTDRRFTKHEHRLMNATEVAPAFARWPLATRVEEVIASAPDCVRSRLRVVEGTVVVERSITWESQNTTTRVTAERDVPVYAPDPLVTCRILALAVAESSIPLGFLALLSAACAACCGLTARRPEFIRPVDPSQGVSP